MKIEQIHVSGFGVWANRGIGPLSPGLNLFHGPNETGKTTLMSFVRAILFGFERKGARRYEPINGGAHGGWLDLTVRTERLRIERKPGRHVRGSVSVYGNVPAATLNDSDTPLLFPVERGTVAAPVPQGGEAELERLLAGTTKTLFHNVFAFGLDELEHFRTLQENEIASHISGAGLGIGAARWSAVQKDIDERQSAVFVPRGHAGTLNALLRELDTIRNDLDRTERQPDEYWSAHEARTRAERRIRELEAEAAEAAAQVNRLGKLLKARPHWERRQRLETQLSALPAVLFPEAGVERLNVLLHQIQVLELEERKRATDLDQRRMRRRELAQQADVMDVERRERAVASLRSLVPRAGALRAIRAGAEERQHAVEAERSALEAVHHSLRPPSLASVGIFVVLLWGAAAALYANGLTWPSAVLAAVSLAPLIWFRQRVAGADAALRTVTLCGERIELCRSEVAQKDADLRTVEQEILQITGRTDVSFRDIDQRAADLERLRKILQEVRLFDEGAARAEADLNAVREQVADCRARVAELIREAGAAGENEFLELARVHTERRQLEEQLRRIPTETTEIEITPEALAATESGYRELQEHLRLVQLELAETRREAGRIEERIDAMERSEERSRALRRKETTCGRIEDQAEQWAVLTLCRALLDETRKVYESERQPDVLRGASGFFATMTEGRYAKVIAPLDGSEILVERADGQRLSPNLLSRGTAEQLYLAMRLALVREYARSVEPLPVVLDDILVNFDPQRSRNTLKAIRELTATHQVLMFTCHPHLVSQVQEFVREAKVFPLE